MSPILVGSKVLTAVVEKSNTFRDITPCSPLKANRHFGGTCRLNLQGQGISQARNKHETASRANSNKMMLVLKWLAFQLLVSSESSVVLSYWQLPFL
jgi:hypothetical protein